MSKPALQAYESQAIDLHHWLLVLCNWKIYKSITIVDLYSSFIDAGRLLRTFYVSSEVRGE